MAQFDPSKEDVKTVLEELATVDDTERDRILTAERTGKKRSTILKEYGVDSSARVDGAGRELYPWEMDPADHVYAVTPDETPEEKEYRETKAAFDEQVVAASPQPSGTAAGVGVAPTGAADDAAAGTDAGTDAGSVTY